MHWTIRRHGAPGPGVHGLGPEQVLFDMEGVCVTNNEEVAAKAQLFPEYFTVTGETVVGLHGEDSSVAELRGLTVPELRAMADRLDVVTTPGQPKGALIDAILAKQAEA